MPARKSVNPLKSKKSISLFKNEQKYPKPLRDSIAGFMWECVCGHTEYSEESPEECVKCRKLSEFIQVPEELITEREKDLVDELGDQI